MKKHLYQDLYNFEERHWWHRNKRATCLTFFQQFSKAKNPRVLDIGCGAGKNVEVFNKVGIAYGIDMSNYAIEFCTLRKLKRVSRMSAEKMSFAHDTFDVVLMLDVLEHISRDSQVVQEVHRVLKKNGIFIVTVPAFPSLWSRWDVELHHKRRYTTDSLMSVLQARKFKIERMTYQYSFLFVPVFIFRKIKDWITGNKEYSSDFKVENPLLNTVFSYLCWIELQYLRFFNLPFGTSIVCVARKVV